MASYQFLLIGLHFRRLHYDRCAPLRHADASWDKTEKTGKVAISA
ncbi:MAG TPA: hypothetical protein VK586_05905 [Streptosporangiaceae bacterium]|nr:hypothetical protein [Streptosporangiaceae bacterium]